MADLLTTQQVTSQACQLVDSILLLKLHLCLTCEQESSTLLFIAITFRGTTMNGNDVNVRNKYDQYFQFQLNCSTVLRYTAYQVPTLLIRFTNLVL